MFPFFFPPTFGAKEDQANAALFPSLLLTRLNLWPPVSSPLVLPLKRFPRECVPSLPRDCCTTGLHRRRDQTPHSGLHMAEWDTEDGATGTLQNTFRQELRTVMPFSWILHKVKCHRCTPVMGYWIHHFRFLAPDQISRVSGLTNPSLNSKNEVIAIWKLLLLHSLITPISIAIKNARSILVRVY